MSSKKRYYYYIEGKDPVNPAQLKYIRRDIECDDAFDGDLVMMAFPISLMKEISSVLSAFHLRVPRSGFSARNTRKRKG